MFNILLHEINPHGTLEVYFDDLEGWENLTELHPHLDIEIIRGHKILDSEIYSESYIYIDTLTGDAFMYPPSKIIDSKRFKVYRSRHIKSLVFVEKLKIKYIEYNNMQFAPQDYAKKHCSRIKTKEIINRYFRCSPTQYRFNRIINYSFFSEFDKYFYVCYDDIKKFEYHINDVIFEKLLNVFREGEHILEIF